MSPTPAGQGGNGLVAALAGLAVVVGVGALGTGILGQNPDPPSVAATSAEPSSVTAAGPSADPSQGSDTAASTAQAPPGPSGTASEDPAAATSTSPGAEPTTDALPPSEPVSVRIPRIEVSSPLHPLGLAADGTLEVPSGDRIDEAAWYDGSPTPGEIGPTVIEGHVTGVGGQASVFFELAALEPGDRAEVEREDGRTVTYEVYRVDGFAKADFPTVDVYGPTAEPELRLITCGGEVDSSTGHHLDNTVVYARMVSG